MSGTKGDSVRNEPDSNPGFLGRGLALYAIWMNWAYTFSLLADIVSWISKMEPLYRELQIGRVR